MTISGRYTSLTPTAWTILGFLSFCPRNGYQLKQAVQRSVGHFWGVSYGQLYPQLKTLSEAGLIEWVPNAGPTGRHQVFQLTEQGGQALREWLNTPPQPAQRRDEGLVKLLFSDHAGTAATRQLIAARRAEAQARQTRAEQIEPGAHWDVDLGGDPADLLAAELVREHTLAMAEAELAWCDRAETMIEKWEGGGHGA